MNSNAGASAAGFGYQYERALHGIFHSTHTGTRFGIETADDVEEQIPFSSGTKVILEQDKLTTATIIHSRTAARTSGTPFETGSKDYRSLKRIRDS